MTFETPAVLTLLPLVPLWWWLSGTRRIRSTVETSVLFLVRRLLEERPRGRAGRRRPPLAAAFEAAALLAAIVGWAGPELLRKGGSASAVFILDRSASASAGGRLRQALEAIRSHEAAPVRESRLVLLPPEPGAPGRPDDPGPIPGTDAAVADDAIVEAALAARLVSDRVIVVSDHVPAGLPAAVGVLATGGGADNAGLVAAGLRGGLLRVVAASTRSRSALLRIGTPAGAVLGDRALHLPAGDEVAVLLEVGADGAGGIVATLEDLRDDIPSDDSVTLLPDPPALRVAVRPGFQDVARAFGAAFGTVVEVGSGIAGDITVVTDREEIPGGGAAVVFLTAEPPRDIEGFATASGALFDGLDMARVRIRQGRPAAPGGETLLSAGGMDLIVRRGRTIEIGFLPSESDWPSHASFPIFFARIAEEADARSAAGPDPVVHRVGHPLPDPARRTGLPAVVRGPGGSRLALAAGTGDSPVAPLRAGLWRIEGPLGSRVFSLATLSREETLAPRLAAPVRREGDGAPRRAAQGSLSLRGAAAALALGLIVAAILARSRAF